VRGTRDPKDLDLLIDLGYFRGNRVGMGLWGGLLVYGLKIMVKRVVD